VEGNEEEKSKRLISGDKKITGISQLDFKKIPGAPLAYWASKETLKLFVANLRLSEKLTTREGMATGNNEKFLRYWFEISTAEIGFNIVNNSQSIDTRKRYFPYIKGGNFRRWTGNFLYVVNWFNDGQELKSFADETTGRIRSHNYNGNYAFREGFSWSGISSGSFAVRHVSPGFMFDAKGPMGYVNNKNDLYPIEAFLNSTVANHLIKMLAPTLDFKLGHILNLPFIEAKEDIITLEKLTKEAIDISKNDWDAFEISWSFVTSPLIQDRELTIKSSINKITGKWKKYTQRLQKIEEEINQIFITHSSLMNEVKSTVDLNTISLMTNPDFRYDSGQLNESMQVNDLLKELISYIIGCMMGRYSLDREGLVYAHEGNKGFAELVAEGAYKTFPADNDGILPLMDDEWFDDDVTSRIKEFVRTVWGEEHLQENLEFIAESLCLYAIKPKKGESALDTIRRYLSTQFWKDHMKMYKKRPIYWLFSSGKEKAFECLVYLHRYHNATLARMRTEYVVPLLARYQANIDRLNEQVDGASGGEATRLKRDRDNLSKKFNELRSFDDRLRHYADMRISIDLDDGVKVNYGKFGDLLADVKAITGNAPEMI
ncbi:BREX-1 system adenine-specific DNA-methyltransferase PglX, partial [Salmonella enterica subsp. enterica serovar Livingstone]|nr:BREX-1 system adenine-specific DNA-methyltransferase PglX [Salmonella enterica subsp. enterica serovar Livingstone]